jgi:hypothetical protein
MTLSEIALIIALATCLTFLYRDVLTARKLNEMERQIVKLQMHHKITTELVTAIISLSSINDEDFTIDKVVELAQEIANDPSM